MVFLSVRFIPGDVIDALEGRMSYLAEPLDRDAMERILGLDQPLAVQYVRWLSGIFLRGTLGKSLLGNLTVRRRSGLVSGRRCNWA